MNDGRDGVYITGLYFPFWFDADAIKASGVRGQYLGDEQKILLDNRLPETIQLRTILHEALHGVFNNSTLTAGGEAGRELNEDLEEKICTLLEREIPDLFKTNPWLMEVTE
jgi:hypothetical protein